MDYFIKGYKQGESIYHNKCNSEEHEKILKEVLQNGTYNECVAWYNGFYKALLDLELESLKQGFTALKKEAEKEKEK